jgi:hypothetical protein
MNSNSPLSYSSLWNSSLCYWCEDPVSNPCPIHQNEPPHSQKICYFWGDGLKRKRVGNLQNRNLRTMKFHIDAICYQDVSSQWQLSPTVACNVNAKLWTYVEPIYSVKAISSINVLFRLPYLPTLWITVWNSTCANLLCILIYTLFTNRIKI